MTDTQKDTKVAEMLAASQQGIPTTDIEVTEQKLRELYGEPGRPAGATPFEHHRDTTVLDLEAVQKHLGELIAAVRQGDMKAFERFWIEGGTEEGDAKIDAVRELLVLRYIVRERAVIGGDDEVTRKDETDE